jgi:putative ABC transport system substrate-binding protein
VKRRAFLATVTASAALLPCNGLAQTPSRRPLIGFIGVGAKVASGRVYSGFPQGMQELGYVEGRDYAFEGRYADGDPRRLPLLVEELVRLRPDVIVTSNAAAALVAKQATTSIPIVGCLMIDPVGIGLVASEARPGTNVTGMLIRVEGLTGKQLEIARDAMPGVREFGVLVNAGNPSNVVQRRECESAAAKLGVSLAPVEVRSADQLGPAFQKFVREGASFVVVLADAMFNAASRQIAAFALASRLPTVYGQREYVENGGLISYGINQRDNFRRAAYYVDRILKGGKPADLPIEFATKIELVINLATAKAIGLTIPPTLLVRADEVIE